MDRNGLKKYILDTYGIGSDRPWAKYPDNEVFRHDINRKWFALVMAIPKSKLGIMGNGSVDGVNLKCDPLMAGSLRQNTGIFPAYHMNKNSWITAVLDGSVPDDLLKMLIDMSYEATSPKIIKRR